MNTPPPTGQQRSEPLASCDDHHQQLREIRQALNASNSEISELKAVIRHFSKCLNYLQTQIARSSKDAFVMGERIDGLEASSVEYVSRAQIYPVFAIAKVLGEDRWLNEDERPDEFGDLLCTHQEIASRLAEGRND